ncbi:hypothetical protein U1Q18_048247 [Sarracenia purpurea var. burkii]
MYLGFQIFRDKGGEGQKQLERSEERGSLGGREVGRVLRERDGVPSEWCREVAGDEGQVQCMQNLGRVSVFRSSCMRPSEGGITPQSTGEESGDEYEDYKCNPPSAYLSKEIP